MRLTSAGTINDKNRYPDHTRQAYYLFSFSKEKKSAASNRNIASSLATISTLLTQFLYYAVKAAECVAGYLQHIHHPYVQGIRFPLSGQLMNHHIGIPFHQNQLMQNGFHLVNISQLARTLYVPIKDKKGLEKKGILPGSIQHNEPPCSSCNTD